MLELHQQHMQMAGQTVSAIQHVYNLLSSQLNATRSMSYNRALLLVGSYILKGLLAQLRMMFYSLLYGI